MRKTQIISTIGPASMHKEIISQLMDAGTRVFRQNYSHGTHKEKYEQLQIIRQLAEEKGIANKVKVLQDLQGSKIRLGILKDEKFDVKKGDTLTLDYALKEHNHGMTLPIQYNLASKVHIGDIAYIFDGKIKTKVMEISSKTAIKVEVENNGWIASKKGINLLGADFGNDIFPEKDINDMKFAADKGYDWVAVSFIQNAENLKEAKKLMKQAGYPETTKLVAKVETYEATKNDKIIDEICKEADIIMIARGDMAYETGFYAVPVIQRKLIASCRKYSKEVIIATQVMGSMTDSPTPTRAEADNVAAAIILGADYLMTSEETTAGKFPKETIEVIAKIIEYTENNTNVIPLEELNKIVKL